MKPFLIPNWCESQNYELSQFTHQFKIQSLLNFEYILVITYIRAAMIFP